MGRMAGSGARGENRGGVWARKNNWAVNWAVNWTVSFNISKGVFQIYIMP